MKFIMFSKHLEQLNYEELADTIAEIGLDGVDLTVRSPGHVLPENVKTDLPKAAKAIRTRGLEIGWITTAITSASSPHAEEILATARDLGIRQFKLGYHRYNGFGNLKQQIEEVRQDLQTLERLCHKYDIQGGMHVHSGPFMSAEPPIIYLLLQGFDPAAVGLYADLGHMGVEGAYGGWVQGLDLLADRLVMLAMKNMAFFWQADPKTGKEGWRRMLVPLERGITPYPEAFKYLKQIGYNGYASFHSEYQGGASWKDLTHAELIEQTKQDFAYVKGIVKELGL
jgi:sugar phosphate isomerase/epimerase